MEVEESVEKKVAGGGKTRAQGSAHPEGLSAPLGAHLIGKGRCSFCVWAPYAKQVRVVLENGGREVPLDDLGKGYHAAIAEEVQAGTRYKFRFETGGELLELPDPASRFQPETVHGPSAVVEQSFDWTDGDWHGIALENFVIYEAHVGTATPEGTFEALIPKLPALRELGVTVLELMPVSQFPGRRNWGYDGVYPYAVQNSYGGPRGLKRLVNACHQHGMAVLLDVVYNHLGPEGNYLAKYGPYFTTFYNTPWGPAINFDGEQSDAVRRYFIENALQWQLEYHFDGLRLDAVHAIRDFSAVPFLQDLARATHQAMQKTGRRFYLVAESDLNDARLLRTEMAGGYGLDAQWSDDFHHALHVLLTGEQEGYYRDFSGVAHLAKAYKEGYIYTGQRSAYRKRFHGNDPYLTDYRQFVVCAQNHDQVGNRLRGERLTALTDFDELKVAAATVILSPFVPLLFMGEEHGEPAPFQYFADHGDPQLREAVRKGRREEFASFGWQDEMPDPFEESTFAGCRVNWRLAEEPGRHSLLRNYYRELLRLRKGSAALREATRASLTVTAHAEKCLEVHYASDSEDFLLVLNFDTRPHVLRLKSRGSFVQVLDSTDLQWGGASHAARHQRIRGLVELNQMSAQAFKGAMR